MSRKVGTGFYSAKPSVKHRRLFHNLGVLPADSGSPEAAVKFLREQNVQVAKMAAAAALKPE